jgi:hypothetical protein
MDAGVDAGVTVSPVELCSRITAATCELKARCYPAFLRLTEAECVELAQASCLAEYERLRPSFEVGRVSVNVEQLEACEQRLTSSACPPSFPPDYPLAVVQPFSDCRLQTGLLTGAAPVGETCDQPVECVAGTFCVKPSGVCRGTCVAYSALDEPCGIGCAPGLRCDGMKCAPLKTLDERCASSAECEPDLLCLGSCRPRRRLGESCRIDFDRLSPCEPGLACDVTPFVEGAEGKCVVPGGDFADCRFHWSCRPGLVCADMNWSSFPASSPPPGGCRAPDTASSNCAQSEYGAFVGDQCAPGLTCADGTNQCETLPQRGQSCTPSKQNCSGFEVYCKPTGSGDVGVCTGPANIGEICAVKIDAQRTVSIPCSSGFCETEVTQQCRPPSRTTGSVCKQDGECISGRCIPQPDQTLRCAPPC